MNKDYFPWRILHKIITMCGWNVIYTENAWYLVKSRFGFFVEISFYHKILIWIMNWPRCCVSVNCSGFFVLLLWWNCHFFNIITQKVNLSNFKIHKGMLRYQKFQGLSNAFQNIHMATEVIIEPVRFNNNTDTSLLLLQNILLTPKQALRNNRKPPL